MIQAVYFDYDGVLTRDKTGSLTTCRALSELTGLPFDALHQALRPYNEALNLGQASHAQIWPQVCQTLKRDLPFDLLRLAFERTPLNEPMLALARRLKPRYRLGLITDNKRDRIEHLRAYQGLDALFDTIVVSAIVGASKEGPAIFEHALATLGLRAEQAVFIDNSAANLVAPAALGMRTLHFDDARNDLPALIDALIGLGVLID